MMRDELLDTVARVGGRLTEMRLDTYVDVAQAMARYLELVKVAALIERAKGGQPVAEALPEVNDLLMQGATEEQREILRASALDGWLLDTARESAKRPGGLRRGQRGARPVHPPPRRRADALGLRHRHLPDLPAQVQVRARLPDPPGADDPPALRDRRAPGARALPLDRRRLARGADGAVRGLLAAQRLRRLRRRAAVPRAGGRGARALLARAGGERRRAGLVRALVRLPARPAPAARPGRPGGQAARRLVRADRLQDGQGRRPSRSCARTSSSRSTRWARASRGA